MRLEKGEILIDEYYAANWVGWTDSGGPMYEGSDETTGLTDGGWHRGGG